jgi:tetrahydromethanopterin S-methyltransferase subunit D
MKTCVSFLVGGITGALVITACHRFGFDRVAWVCAVVFLGIVLLACAVSTFFIRPES